MIHNQGKLELQEDYAMFQKVDRVATKPDGFFFIILGIFNIRTVFKKINAYFLKS